MKIIIPMGGCGIRFVNKGYKDPKPLITVGGRKIIDYVLDMFDRNNDEFIFICNKKHIFNSDLKNYLIKSVKNCNIVEIDDHKLGPVWSLKFIKHLLVKDEPVIVSYCDNSFKWDSGGYNQFKNIILEKKYDGVILTHTGFHPHTLSATKMAFLKIDGDKVLEIKEKECYTDNPMNEHASTGIYYFRSGKNLSKYIDQMIEKNIHYNGEYYVTLLYNLMIRDNQYISFYNTPYITVFGTPEEVENYESWKTILQGKQIKSECDLIDCYRYWKLYENYSS